MLTDEGTDRNDSLYHHRPEHADRHEDAFVSDWLAEVDERR